MRILIGLLAAPLLLGLTQTAGGQEETRPARRSRAFWSNEQTVELLALAPEQIEQLEADGAAFAVRDQEISEQWAESRRELQETLAEDRFSPEKANRLRDEIAKLAAERSTLTSERQIAIRRVLTADQWAELRAGQELRAERRQMMRQRMDQRMRRRLRGGAGDAAGEPEETE
jgi:Spy/CpxP family protein refolding chaperone